MQSKKFGYYQIFEKDLPDDCVKEVGLNGLKWVNKGYPQICRHEKKGSFFGKKNWGEQKFGVFLDMILSIQMEILKV